MFHKGDRHLLERGEQCRGAFASVGDAWQGLVRDVAENGSDVEGSVDPLSVGSGFGNEPRSFREIHGETITITGIRNRLFYSTARPLRISYLLANVIWAATGSNRLRRIAFYNRRGEEFSDDGVTLAAAPGNRIIRSAVGNQFQLCSQLLKSDKSTRRAVMSVYNSSDVGSRRRDTSCLISLQFLLRRSQLHCIAVMRSQSVAMVFPYDAFLFTLIQEAMAVDLGVEPGNLTMQFGSLHFYHDERSVVNKIAEDHSLVNIEMPPMNVSPRNVSPALARQEAEIRLTGSIETDLRDPYWSVYMHALRHAALIERGRASWGEIPHHLRATWFDTLATAIITQTK